MEKLLKYFLDELLIKLSKKFLKTLQKKLVVNPRKNPWTIPEDIPKGNPERSSVGIPGRAPGDVFKKTCERITG